MANECRTVVLASGSLAPIPSLCAELNLFSSDTEITQPMNNSSSTTPAVQKRLQIQPKPLEADHVVNLEKQLFVTSIGQFQDGTELHGMKLSCEMETILLFYVSHFPNCPVKYPTRTTLNRSFYQSLVNRSSKLLREFHTEVC